MFLSSSGVEINLLSENTTKHPAPFISLPLRTVNKKQEPSTPLTSHLEMAPIFNAQIITGLPICLSGITHPLALAEKMADHDRRRKGFKKLLFRAGKSLRAVSYQEMIRSTQSSHQDELEEASQEIRIEEVAVLIRDPSCIYMSSCTAKAA